MISMRDVHKLERGVALKPGCVGHLILTLTHLESNRWNYIIDGHVLIMTRCAIFRSASRHPRWSLTFVGRFGPSKRPSRNSTKPCKMGSKRVDKSMPGSNVHSTSVRICWSVYWSICRRWKYGQWDERGLESTILNKLSSNVGVIG